MLLGLLASAPPSVARAQSEPPRAPLGPRRVPITLVAPAGEVASLRAALAEATADLRVSCEEVVLSDLDVGALVAPRAAEAGVLARVFIDVRGPVGKLYLIDEERGRVLVRDVPRRGTSASLVHEQLSQIVRASLETLADGGSVGVRRQDIGLLPTEPPLRRVEPIARPQPLASVGGAYYSVGAYAPGNALVHGPGVLFGIKGGEGRSLWTLLGSGEYRGATLADSRARLHLDILPLRLLGGVGVSLGSSQFYAEFGPGVDLSRVAAKKSTLTFDVESPRWRATLVFRVQARWVVRASRDWVLFSLASLDLDPSRTRYVVQVDGETEALASLWSLRPNVGIGLGF